MTDPIETGSTQPKAGMPTAGLEAYFTANRRGYTDEALAASARASGYSPAAIATALAAAKTAEISAPVLARARVIVLASYLLVYAALVVGMLTNPSGNSYGAGSIGTVVLTVTLGIAWLISVVWMRRRGRKIQVGGSGLTAVLALPVVLLVVVAGSCIATGLPNLKPV